jgi:hypothetical protein
MLKSQAVFQNTSLVNVVETWLGTVPQEPSGTAQMKPLAPHPCWRWQRAARDGNPIRTPHLESRQNTQQTCNAAPKVYCCLITSKIFHSLTKVLIMRRCRNLTQKFRFYSIFFPTLYDLLANSSVNFFPIKPRNMIIKFTGVFRFLNQFFKPMGRSASSFSAWMRYQEKRQSASCLPVSWTQEVAVGVAGLHSGSRTRVSTASLVHDAFLAECTDVPFEFRPTVGRC